MEMGAFAGPRVIERVRQRSQKAGILRGHELALSMLWLRPQELIWSNVVNNYLLGNSPPEFDLLYWNNDWTNLPARLHSDVLDMFFGGDLMEPGKMAFLGESLDLTRLDCDKFILGGLSDHITPWKACYRSALAFGGDKRFLLSNSGHMQTMLNSPTRRNASYFINDELPQDEEEWLDTAQLQQGSWWQPWSEWLRARSSAEKNAPRNLGNTRYPAGVKAPGSYVYQQSE
jgi:polyhydroxyalkanoate synthase